MNVEHNRSSSSSDKMSRFGQEIHVLGHAVDAPIITPVGDRNSHIGDRATERVDERPSDHRRVRRSSPDHIDTRRLERKAPAAHAGQCNALRCIPHVTTIRANL